MSVQTWGASCDSASTKASSFRTATNKQDKDRKMLAVKSSWTPLTPNNGVNEKLFKERKELVINWFEKWNGRQRKIILDCLLARCKSTQLTFVHDIVHPQMPKANTDFTRLFPRYLTLKIFSFLDPRTLCQCGQVSWYWRHLSENDAIWMTKCLRLGWLVTFPVSPFEVGVWKRLYADCVADLRRGVIPLSNVIHTSNREDTSPATAMSISNGSIRDNPQRDLHNFCSTPHLPNTVEKPIENVDKRLLRPTISSQMKIKGKKDTSQKASSLQRFKSCSLQNLTSGRRKDILLEQRVPRIPKASKKVMMKNVPEPQPTETGNRVHSPSLHRPDWAKRIRPVGNPSVKSLSNDYLSVLQKTSQGETCREDNDEQLPGQGWKVKDFDIDSD